MLATEGQRDDVVRVPVVRVGWFFADVTDSSVSFPHDGAVNILDPLAALSLSPGSLVSSVYLWMLGLILRLVLLLPLRMCSLIRSTDGLRFLHIVDVPPSDQSFHFLWIRGTVTRLIGALLLGVLFVVTPRTFLHFG